ncbi:hypothetical protein K5V21_15070 [Clostridium sardiniense]|uniref:Uncharacterized protein n=1 Tax=Clostridium sardiniense TaxID=29369 RepID=A0ABS7L161_CLOSR|nr:hypothetical protein [Clostridium sardiniense]MBY0756769.1 hypothetical protein [Clostridium sardiniense]MDQ0460455.1 cell division protein YceG involved in septum cleavage [Clostridium sardiniense]
MKKKKINIASIILYIIAVIVLIYMVWAIVSCHEYISQMVAQGALVKEGNAFNIISYYMTNCAQYGFYAIVLVSLGIILQKLDSNKSKVTTNNVVVEEVEKIEEK